jgi:hypothetical protein
MPHVPGDIGSYDGTYPPDGARDMKESDWRGFISPVAAFLRRVSSSWAGKAGEVVLGHADGTGAAQASIAGGAVASFAGLKVANFMQDDLPCTGSIVATNAVHLSRALNFANTGAATITLALTADPATGVQSGFWCEARRLTGSSTVTLILSGGLTNANPDSHTGIQVGRSVRIKVIGTEVYMEGYTVL